MSKPVIAAPTIAAPRVSGLRVTGHQTPAPKPAAAPPVVPQLDAGSGSVAFVTMIRDEPFFLPRWIAHYAPHVPKSHMFILVDGLDQILPPQAEGCQVLRLPRRPPAPGWDRLRWQMLSDFAASLLGRFDVVVVNDVDELLVADPAHKTPLLWQILRARDIGVISPFALEVIHREDLETPLDQTAPILGQRRYARINATYCKPCILSRPVRWSVGGHYSDHPTLHLDPVLHLFHLRFVDKAMLLNRQAKRAGLMEGGAAAGAEQVAGSGWAKDIQEIVDFMDSFQKKGAPIENDFTFDWQRHRIKSSWTFDEAENIWRHEKLHNRKTYVIPDRFFGLL